MSVADHEIDDRPFPRAALIGAGALVGFTLLATAAVRLHVVPGPRTTAEARVARHVTVIEERSLRFLDQKNGAVLVEDVGRGTVATVIQPGTNNGFIRGVLRGLARDRKLRGIGQQPPFKLTHYNDGELTLTDTSTGRAIDLGSFGPTNYDAFGRLLVTPPPIRARPGQ